MTLLLRRTAMGAVVVLLGLLAACQTARKPSAPVPSTGKSASLRAMEQVSKAAYQCWFASKDSAFKPYRFANELNSLSGQPRFLLVPARHFEGRPLLVVQAKGGSSRVEVFGPLMGEPLGRRISADVSRWSSGSASCSDAA